MPKEIHFEFVGESVRVSDHFDGADPNMETVIINSIEADPKIPAVQILNALPALGVALKQPAVWEFCG